MDFIPRLEWVDSSDPGSRRRVQVHADRESRRKRRWMQDQTLQKARQSTLEAFNFTVSSPNSTSPPPSSSIDIAADTELFPGNSQALRNEVSLTTHYITQSKEQAHNSNRKGTVHPQRHVDNEEDKSVMVSRDSQYPDPQNRLSTLRRDPFSILPGTLDHEDQRLVDHCASHLC